MEQILTDARRRSGVTVTAAAGDGGSTDGVSDGQQHVDFPASAPHALACGGTALQASGGSDHRRDRVERHRRRRHRRRRQRRVRAAWLPEQRRRSGERRHRPVGRGVPDVAGDADPQTGYTIRVDGRDQTIGGTSAVAPLWAGLIALLNRVARRAAGVRAAAAVRLGRVSRVPRHRQRQQRRLLRPGRVGRVHGPGLAERLGAAAVALILRSPESRSDLRAPRRCATSCRRRRRCASASRRAGPPAACRAGRARSPAHRASAAAAPSRPRCRPQPNRCRASATGAPVRRRRRERRTARG